MDEEYTPVSPLLVTFRSGVKFDVYLRHGEAYTLYAKHGKFTKRHRDLLQEKGMKLLYIKQEAKQDYNEYIESNFGNILQDNAIPVEERSKVMLEHCSALLQQAFEQNLPENLDPEFYTRVQKTVDISQNYFSSTPEALKTIGSLVSHTYQTYSHCVNVFVYTTLILHGMGVGTPILRQAGVGAMLHDIGKIKIPSSILNKPGRLSPEEFEAIKTHPAKGAALCQDILLSTVALNCVLFHHEKLDGSGYPSGASKLPDYVKAVSVADIYDALISERPYGKVHTPFEAFTLIASDVEKGKLDREVCTFFIKRLSGGEVEV